VSVWDARNSRRLAWGALALIGPLAWLLHNWIAHGDAFHFAARVSAYQRALGASAQAYPLALLREEPEIVALSCVMLIAARRSLPASLPRAAGALAMVLVALTLAAIPGGAPTHHSGRALLAIWLVMAIYLGAGVRAAMRARPYAFSALVVMVMFAGLWLRRTDPFTPRIHETAIGRDAASLTEPVLVEAVDYGYFAIVAASARPEAMIVDRSLDPRGTIPPSSFESIDTVKQRARACGARYAVTKRALGEPLARSGPWSLIELTP
jgi:hypothetical protein